jgi:hypothetical protein
MSPTRVMIEVCEQCFGGDWQAMKEYAKRYDPTGSPPLGKVFRELIGSRNRSQFWLDVEERDAPDVVDGDSISGMKRAIELCKQGVSSSIAQAGNVIGKLHPVSTPIVDGWGARGNQKKQINRLLYMAGQIRKPLTPSEIAELLGLPPGERKRNHPEAMAAKGFVIKVGGGYMAAPSAPNPAGESDLPANN